MTSVLLKREECAKTNKHTHTPTHTPARLGSSQEAIVAQPTQADPLISALSFLEAVSKVKVPGIKTFFDK